MRSFHWQCPVGILVLLAIGCSSVFGKICYDNEKVPKLLQNTTKVVKNAMCNYNCFLTEHRITVPVTVEQESCSLEYETRRKEVCCEGYHRSGSDCLPSCKHQCVFGECTAPETCTCYAGYQKVNDFTCEPVCEEPPCENGRCVAPGSCICDEGFERRSSDGKCIEVCGMECELGWCEENECRCHEGYAPDEQDGSRCVPQCDPECQNGACVQPNVCQCGAGYTLSPSNPFVCEPICSGSCKTCIAPNTCVCEDGYQLNSMNECIPICSVANCTNGRCIAPEVCQCDAGYTLIGVLGDESECVPVCENCVNGECVAPGVCVCDDLYHKGPDDLCEPYCPGGCLHGVCIGPGVCRCRDGYLWNEGSGVCEAHCRKPCENGVCSGPDKCSCNEGYQLDRRDATKCVPKCAKPCIHGRCVAPDVCECSKGYVKMENSRNICEAKCTNGCSNGVCVGPERCECLPGYFATTSAINSKKSMCTPYCKNKCVNAYCIKPNVCQCITGYRFAENTTTVCEPICDDGLLDCTNGRCVQPNICECDEGFILAVRDGKTVCEPKPCDRVCVNGFCEGEDRCVCLEGYRPSARYDYICEPVCEPGCTNGMCIAPNMCVCKEGFVASAHGHCEPFCSAAVVDCSNGVCLGNDQCQCNVGYYPLAGGTGVTDCVPICASNCANGQCVAPGICKCNEGFSLNELSDVCEPVCDPPCENGACMEPDLCQCDEGFVPEVEDLFELNHVCAPYCDPSIVDCSNGFCGASNFCRCNDGFYPSTTNDGIMTCIAIPEPVVVECPPVPEPVVCDCDTSCPAVDCPEVEPPICNFICPEPLPCPKLTCPTTPPTTTVKPTPCQCPTHPPCPKLSCPAPIVLPCEAETESASQSEEHTVQVACDSDYVDCSHGTCLGNNICECYEGYRKAIGSNDLIICEPICDRPCLDGVCIAPGVCECFEGYAEDHDGYCQPVCEEACVNADCVAPNVCRCSEGYEEEWDGVCRKSCPSGCTNGVCLDGECVCDDGWKFVEGSCEEIGQEEPLVEELHRPSDNRQIEKIQSRFSGDCFDGYEFSEETGGCEPMCNDCENGHCTEPNECVCNEGFVRTYIDGIGSCRLDEEPFREVTTTEAEIAELQAPESVIIEKDEQFSFLSIFDRTHLLIGIVAATSALILMLASYWICTYLKEERPFPTETVIE